MRDELNNIAHIDDYLAGRLSSSEKMIIENKIKINSEFEKDVNAQREILNYFKIRSFKDVLEKHHRKYAMMRFMKNLLILLIALALVFFTVLHFFFPSNTQSIHTKNKSRSEQTAVKQIRSTKDSVSSKQKVDSNQKSERDRVALISIPLENSIDTSPIMEIIPLLPNVTDEKMTTAPIDTLVKDSIIPKELFPKTTLWQIDDQFASYFRNQVIPIRISSKVDELDFSYNITGTKGTLINITLFDPNGKEIKILNLPNFFKQKKLEGNLKIGNIKGLWEIHIHTVGQGYFSMKIKSIE